MSIKSCEERDIIYCTPNEREKLSFSDAVKELSDKYVTTLRERNLISIHYTSRC